jgi:intracellular septation protein
MANEVVWRNVSTEAWIKFKMFGVMPMTMLFAVALVPLMMKHMLPPPAAATPEPSEPGRSD